MVRRYLVSAKIRKTGQERRRDEISLSGFEMSKDNKLIPCTHIYRNQLQSSRRQIPSRWNPRSSPVQVQLGDRPSHLPPLMPANPGFPLLHGLPRCRNLTAKHPRAPFLHTPHPVFQTRPLARPPPRENDPNVNRGGKRSPRRGGTTTTSRRTWQWGKGEFWTNERRQ